MRTPISTRLLTAALAVLVTGCASAPGYDYSALRQAKPASILVMPALNQSPDVTAPAGVLSQVTLPLAEAGYYVLPVSLSMDMFAQNGMHTAEDAQALPIAKLREIFGADAALYLDIRDYGTSYAVLSSASVVTLSARLVDLRTGRQLWDGNASASSAEGRNTGSSLLGLLVTALVTQILETMSESSLEVAAIANQRLLSPGLPGGLLHGPRSPEYGKPAP
ncbi:DUF799 domain-containing protein [Comamonas composti]|uniref:DUF799 domain-containing protein n=1 Tax=Comamonas composti TaxID=408558 RepID=UPI000401D648|nr:DUF799 domain-containing protein [Comamonas composti]